jgi:hypothetical protein
LDWWHAENGQRFCELVRESRILRDLSIVLLDRTDLDGKHHGFFTTDQMDTLYEIIARPVRDLFRRRSLA